MSERVNYLENLRFFCCMIFYHSLVGGVTWIAILVTSTPIHLVSISDQMTPPTIMNLSSLN